MNTAITTAPTAEKNTRVVLDNKVKATMIVENSMGLTVVRHVWLFGYYSKDRYQGSYTYGLCPIYTIKGKRKRLCYKLERVVLCEGWQDLKSQEVDGFTCFDGATFENTTKDATNVIISHNAYKA